jgi:hypothetical protein
MRNSDVERKKKLIPFLALKKNGLLHNASSLNSSNYFFHRNFIQVTHCFFFSSLFVDIFIGTMQIIIKLLGTKIYSFDVCCSK